MNNTTKRIMVIIECIMFIILAGCSGKQPMNIDDNTAENTTVSTEYILEEIKTTAATEDTRELTTEEVSEAEIDNPREKLLVAIDPGHQSEDVDMSDTEPNAPGSGDMKRKATGGTVGKYTGVPEYKLNLDISLMLQETLENMGYQVIMTREDNETAISNMERACLANDAGADISVRIHANGSDDPSVNGALALVSSDDNPYVGYLYDESYRLADNILNSYCECTGMRNLGVSTNDTMTGINWSEIPVMILEMGFMSNESDDNNMENDDYREKMVEGIAKGIDKYYGFDGMTGSFPENDSGTRDNESYNGGTEDLELKSMVDQLLEQQREKGTVASAYLKNLKTGQFVDLSTATHRAASIIKLYIAGCTYQNISMITAASNQTESDIDELVRRMITVSDNDAANTLVRILGGGDAEDGMNKVTSYAQAIGCHDTRMGRLMLDFSSDEDNYTTVTDTETFIEKIYRNELAGADKIISYMKQQERTTKIPAGIPQGIPVANKTGELEDVEHDVAIVYGVVMRQIILSA